MPAWEHYFTGKRVWVTGASSGIGRALVELLGRADVETIASARSEALLAQLAERHPSVESLPFDLSRLDSLADVAARAWGEQGIDVLINNAGISQRSLFVESDPEALERVIDLNLKGTLRLTQSVAARMIRAGSGHLAVVSSVVVNLPTPLRTAYAASKAGLHGLYDALRGELEPHDIAISIAIPGAVQTEISHHAITATGAEHGKLDQNQATGHSPQACALEILKGLARRRREFLVSMTPRLRIGLLLRRIAPGVLWRTLAKTRVT